MRTATGEEAPIGPKPPSMKIFASRHWPSAVVFVVAVAAVPLSGADIRFNRDIRPIFSDNCFACHGPDGNARQADLRLDRREVALASEAIVPGDTAASKLVAKIRHENELLRMPPAYSGKSLTARQKSLLVEWIEQGAEYERHWAYIPPERPDAPNGSAAIDHFVAQRLEAASLEPAGQADSRTLARRASFDLTGLPPAPGEVEALENDSRPEAFERFVDKLLDSDHYGERMAVHWLDLVRYADTVGFHGDVAVNVYPYRDYVIRSFNENKPFDEFTREQIGGDLMPDPSLGQRVASAYNRLGRMTNEGGSQAKEYLAKYSADRARTVSTVWLASTMGCAECHDHKFDPFLAKDFYAMQAFFADIEEEGVFAGYGDWGDKLLVPSVKARERIADIDARIAALLDQGTDRLPATDENLAAFAKDLRESLAKWQLLEPSEVRNDCSDPDIWDCEKFSIVADDEGFAGPRYGEDGKPSKLAQIVEADLGTERVKSLLVEVAAAEDCDDFFLGEIEVRWLRPGEPPLRVAIESMIPDWDDGSASLQSLEDSNHHTGWTGDPSQQGVRRAVFVFEQALEPRAGDKLQVTSYYDEIFGLHGISYRQRLWVTGRDSFDLPVEASEAALLRADSWQGGDRGAIERLFARRTASNPHWRDIRDLEREGKKLLDHADETLVTKAIEPRTIRVLPRGNWMDDSGEIVEPQAPSFLRQIPGEDGRLNRLDLADWIVDRDNPLTARVFVNRLWKLFFGTGISKVLDDLGSQGEPPANPELLDWLAVEFMESGWDVKHIVRTMLLSETYRRSSDPTPELRAADPGNRLHGYQTAKRLDAEFIRDNALAVSGLLNARVGGRSGKPYQPAGYYKELNFPKRVYHADTDGNQYRRGLYTHWQRTYLHPAMRAFDAPSREECAADRAQSNTPLQSLVLLNDPSYVEAAKSLAVRILGSEAADDSARMDFAYQLAFSRTASRAERDVLLALLERQRGRFRASAEEARELLAVGMRPVPPSLAQAEVAAWTAVSRALLNKHEFVMKY